MNQLSVKEMEMHVPIVGWLKIIGNVFLLLVGLCGLVFFVGIGFIPAAEGDPEALGILTIVGLVGLMFFAVLALPGIVAGYGLLKRYRWAQVLGIVLGFLNLLNFPLGTAIGAYTLFVLFQNSANEYFAPNGSSGAAVEPEGAA
jgi:hypothetical protein